MKILKFFSDSCGPCKVLEKNLQIANITYESHNVENSSIKLMEKYKIRAVPTLIKIDDEDNEIERFNGIMKPEELKKWCNEN